MQPLQICFAFLMFFGIVLLTIAMGQLSKRQRIRPKFVALIGVAVFGLTRFIAFVL